MERHIEGQPEYKGTVSAQEDVSGWAVGFIMFASLLMIMMGSFHIFAGLVGIIDDAFYETPREYFTDFSATSWGWIHLVGGVIVVAAGIGLLSGSLWSRILVIGIALLSAIVNFAFIPYYPVWSILMIAISIGVIWALMTHGHDFESV